MKFTLRIGVLVIALLDTVGCASAVLNNLKIVSAGHTGCLPDENEISNVNVNLIGVGTWYATCKGEVYLCSGVSFRWKFGVV